MMENPINMDDLGVSISEKPDKSNLFPKQNMLGIRNVSFEGYFFLGIQGYRLSSYLAEN